MKIGKNNFIKKKIKILSLMIIKRLRLLEDLKFKISCYIN